MPGLDVSPGWEPRPSLSEGRGEEGERRFLVLSHTPGPGAEAVREAYGGPRTARTGPESCPQGGKESRRVTARTRRRDRGTAARGWMVSSPRHRRCIAWAAASPSTFSDLLQELAGHEGAEAGLVDCR